MTLNPNLPPDAPSLHPPAPYPFKWTRRLVFLLACLFLSVLAGGITAIVITHIDSAGYFVRWQRLPDLPAAATSLALWVEEDNENLSPTKTLLTQLASGDVVALSLMASNWQPGTLTSDNAALPCASSLAALARTTNPPNGLTGCIYYYEIWMDCDSEYAFALDGDGRVWQWINPRCALGRLGVAFFTFVAAGLVYLLLFSVLALVWLRRRERTGR